jgi:MFS transporter, OFA family, oxalate/formate antiporter
MAVLSEATTTRAVRASTRRGWAVVAGAFAVMFVTFGTAYSFSAFFASLQQAFAASRGDIAFSFSIAVPLYYLIGAVSGPLADRFGSRTTCLLGVVVAGLGLIFAATATALWQLYVGFGLGLGIGIGFSFVPSIAAVQRWHVRRRGFASGIAVSGIGFGTLVMPPVAALLIGSTGWRGAWSILGLSIIVIGGAATLFIDNTPERHGALPDGGVIGLGTNVHAGPVAGHRLRQAVTSRAFILLYLSLVVIWIGASIPFVHLVPYAEDHGLSHGTAVTIFGLVGIGSIAGRFLLGGIADRIGPRWLLAAVFAGVALMQLWWLAAISAWQLAVFAFTFGVCYGGFVALYPALTVDYFGGRNASGIIGVLYTGGAVGSFLGPKLAGDAFDRFGSYTISIAVGAACALLAVVFVIAAPEPDLAPPP